MNNTTSRIVDYLLLHSCYMDSIGLFHGKMGVVLSLYLYADAHKDDVLQDFAWELFQQIFDGIHTDMPVGLDRGLAGIGYGTTLLCQRGLVECSLNDVLGDVDCKIMERDPRRMTDFSLRSGAMGLMQYIRLRQSVEPICTFDATYVTELQSAMARRNMTCAAMGIMDMLAKPAFAEEDYVDKLLGIDGGSAYYILKSTML